MCLSHLNQNELQSWPIAAINTSIIDELIDQNISLYWTKHSLSQTLSLFSLLLSFSCLVVFTHHMNYHMFSWFTDETFMMFSAVLEMCSDVWCDDNRSSVNTLKRWESLQISCVWWWWWWGSFQGQLASRVACGAFNLSHICAVRNFERCSQVDCL